MHAKWYGVIPLGKREQISGSGKFTATFVHAGRLPVDWNGVRDNDIGVCIAVKPFDEQPRVTMSIHFEEFEFQKSHGNLWVAVIPHDSYIGEMVVEGIFDCGEIVAFDANIGNHIHVFEAGTLEEEEEECETCCLSEEEYDTCCLSEEENGDCSSLTFETEQPVTKTESAECHNVQIMSEEGGAVEVDIGSSQLQCINLEKGMWTDVLQGAGFPDMSPCFSFNFSSPVFVRYAKGSSPPYAVTRCMDGCKIVSDSGRWEMECMDMEKRKSASFPLRSKSVYCGICEHYNVIETPEHRKKQAIKQAIRNIDARRKYPKPPSGPCRECKTYTHRRTEYMGEWDETEIVKCDAHREEEELSLLKAIVVSSLL